jgi:hypothetical protein
MDGGARPPYGLAMIRLHRFAALVAAYAIALQALLAAFAVPGPVAFAGVDAASICFSHPGSGSPQLPNHDGCCPGCISGSCGLAADTPRAVALVRWSASVPAATATHDKARVRIAGRSPHAARAPPAA